jgi:hypothetical protein
MTHATDDELLARALVGGAVSYDDALAMLKRHRAEVERLTRERDEATSAVEAAKIMLASDQKLIESRDAELAAERKRCGELERLVQCLLDNDPNADAADGVSVLDVWRRDARAALAGKDARGEAGEADNR